MHPLEQNILGQKPLLGFQAQAGCPQSYADKTLECATCVSQARPGSAPPTETSQENPVKETPGEVTPFKGPGEIMLSLFLSTKFQCDF